MATIRPSRTYFDAVATSWCYFDGGGGGTVIEHNGSILMIGLGSWKSAIQFDNTTAPSWTSDGPIAGAGLSLISVLSQLVDYGGGNTISIAPILDPWDSSSNIATMQGLTVGTYRTMGPVASNYGIPNSWHSATQDFPTYGFMLRTSTSTIARLATDPLPMIRYFYQYSPTSTTRSDATERETFSADTLAVLAGTAKADHYRVDIDVLSSEIRPGLSDIEIAVLSGSSAGANTREATWPESWQLDIPASGSVPVSLVSNTDISGIRGMPVESEITMVLRDGTEASLGKQTQFVGDTTYRNDGTGEIELRSPLSAILSSQVVAYDPYSTATVNYLAEMPPYILVDMLMNTGKVLYKRVHYNDLAQLLSRFSGVFSALTYSASDLDGKTVSDIIAEIGPLFGISITQSSAGCVGFWHPAVYRESMRVWTIDEGDCVAGGYSVTPRGVDGQYGYVRITNTVATPLTTIVWSSNSLPSYPGFLETPFEFTTNGAVFDDTSIGGTARAALGRQLAERLCNEYTECELNLRTKGLGIDIGDVVKLTGAGLSETTRFLVLSVNGQDTTGQKVVKGIHYPKAKALSSSFEAHGIVGTWRWLDETGAFTSANTAPTPTDADPTSTSFATITNEHWQGAMFATGNATWSVPLISATKHDVIEQCYMIHDGVAGNGGADTRYLPLFYWTKATGNQALEVGFFRPTYSGPGIDYSAEAQMYVAHIVDTTAPLGTYTFVAVAYSPNGVCGRQTGTSDIPVSISLQWDDSGNVNLYLDRSLVVSGTGFSKSGWTTLLMSSNDSRAGCVRHLQTDEAITDLQRLLGLNGLDPYSP